MSFTANSLDILRPAETLGGRVLANGTRLIGHVPHVAPEAYLHVVFPGLDQKGIDQIVSEIGRLLPDPLRDFFFQHNGLDLFSGSLSIFGLRTICSRSNEPVWQPYSISLPNVDERPRDASDDLVFFGFYDWDGSLLYMSTRSPKVYRCSRESAKPLNEWPTLEHALVSEVRRLSQLFDSKGKRINENEPSVPPVPKKTR